jgi:hypothetical protein
MLKTAGSNLEDEHRRGDVRITCVDEGLHRQTTSRRSSSPLATEATTPTSQQGNDAIAAII